MKQRDIIRYSAACFLFLLTLAVYLPALQNGFVNWDDNIYVYENKNIQSIDYGFWMWSLTTRVMDLWHPLSFITFAFDFAVWGLNPTGYHLTNIVLHALNTFLVYVLSVRLIECGSGSSHKKAIIAGFVTALLFGIHPLHVESVAWVTERKDVLCAFFFLSSLLVYLRYASSENKRYNYYLCIIFYTLALMSKPMAISLPIVLLILDYYPLTRMKFEGNTKKVLIEKLPFFIIGPLAVLMTLWPKFSGTAAKATSHPIVERMLVFMHGYVFYLQKMMFPANLAPLYPYPLKVSFLDYEYLGSVALFFLISAYCINSLKRGKALSCIWLYYVVSLVPVIGVTGTGTLQFAADRYTYLPSIGPFLLAGLATGYVIERNSKRLLPIVAALLILSGGLIHRTVKQIKVWHDPLTLWTHEARILPDASVGHGILGLTYTTRGNYQLALRELNKAIELDTSYAEAYYIRGTVYYKLVNYQQAINDLNKAIEIKPDYVNAYTSRGTVYCKMGNYTQSIKDLKKAIELDPRHKEAFDSLGMVYSQMGDNRQALAYYKKAAALGLKK